MRRGQHQASNGQTTSPFPRSSSDSNRWTSHGSLVDPENLAMPKRAHYLIVDGHSIIFAWPELRKLHARRSSLAREALIKQLRDYQDWTGVRAVVVFDGKGKKTSAISEPDEVQIFYSRSGQSADAIVERLASKYAKQFDLTVATSDSMEAETVHACGAEQISPDALRALLSSARRS